MSIRRNRTEPTSPTPKLTNRTPEDGWKGQTQSTPTPMELKVEAGEGRTAGCPEGYRDGRQEVESERRENGRGCDARPAGGGEIPGLNWMVSSPAGANKPGDVTARQHRKNGYTSASRWVGFDLHSKSTLQPGGSARYHSGSLALLVFPRNDGPLIS